MPKLRCTAFPRIQGEAHRILIFDKLRILYRLNKLERNVSELDDITARLTADITNAITAIGDLRAEIANLGSTGADVTALTAAADALEAALSSQAVASPAPATGDGGVPQP